MKRNYFKSKLFLKYIWSYLFILLIPLILMTVFIYENAVANLRNEIEHSRLDQLTQTKVIIDGRMKELGEIASRISYDNRLTPYRVHDPVTSGEAIQALDQYKATSSIIDEIFLYFHKDGKIYSSKGLYDFAVFADNFSFQSWSKTELFRDLNSAKYPTMRPADTVAISSNLKETALAYLIPITPNNPDPHGTVMYLIRESELTSLIDSILGNYKGLTYILDNEGRMLVDDRQGEMLSDAETKSLIGLPPGIYERKIGGKAHSIVSVKSENNGWTYVAVMPSSQFFSSVLHVRSFIIMLFTITVLVGAAIALLLAKMQYQPISTLVEFAASRTDARRSRDSSAAAGNELDRIRTALQDYSSRVDLQEPFARNHFLSMLLKYGNVQSLSPGLQEAFDLRFDRSRHFVMVIGSGSTDDSRSDRQERQEMIKLLNRIEFPELDARGYGVELPQLDQLGLIVSFNPNAQGDEFTHVRRIVEAVRDNLLELFDAMPMIGVGTCYPSPDQLNQSFIEACSAFELRASAGHGTVTYFEMLSYTHDHAVWIPNNTLMKLSQSLKQGSFDVAAHIIGSGIEDMQSKELSAWLMRCICFDLLNTMLKTASELGIHSLLQEVAPNMMYGNSLDELKRSLLNLASRICNQVERNNQKQEQSLMDQIVAYIDGHYKDHTLSLETVAFEFSVSPSHVSRSFKEKMGLNFIQYIWQKRLEEVKHQLKTTNDPLKDIIVRVGYQDTPNFTRKFKKETGYTPGQYRKLFFENGQPLPEAEPDDEA
ncbi:AraC family transcriptional regulator [Gordoniibacillus kamchatkensis]|uniref:AraC family transcriptional regulator n=1 Tax=Gordoniibacillus kamchatkensis TaxID=1590651 RepID=A0ABR5AM14_9BACL|nr:helix-turn-helix domain-containing protein [Paenibacillus sp. VKM B-2647]KIL41977.1 AraC family transcriptional regulator [Paenibacillus sp. VKM B-2647]